MTAGTQAIKFGTWMRDNREATSTNGNFNGSFTFPSVTAYIDTCEWPCRRAKRWRRSPPPARSTRRAAACPPISPTQRERRVSRQRLRRALFFQDDWKYNKFLTLSGGLRWETQNHTADHSDWGPRVAFAYALDGHKKNGSFKDRSARRIRFLL